MIVGVPIGFNKPFPALIKLGCLFSILFFLVIIASASQEDGAVKENLTVPDGPEEYAEKDRAEIDGSFGKGMHAYDPISSLEELLREQSNLLFGFERLMNSTPTTIDEKSKFLDSFEDLLRRQTILFDGFSDILKSQWTKMGCERQRKFLASFEDLLHREMMLFSRFNDHLDINWGDLACRERVKLLSSFEDLLRRQSELLRSFEDLNKLSYGGLLIEKFADKDCVYRGETVTYKYVIKNRFNYSVRNITVWDDRLGLIKKGVTLGPGKTKAFTKKAVLKGAVCNTAEVCGEDPCGKRVSDKSNLVCVKLILVGENLDNIRTGNQDANSMGSHRPSAFNTMEIKKNQKSFFSDRSVLNNLENIDTGNQTSRGSTSGNSANVMRIVANQK